MINLLSLPIPILEGITVHLIQSNNDAKLLLHNHPLQPLLLEKKDLLVAKIGNPKYLDTYYGLGLTRVQVIAPRVGIGFIERLFTIFPDVRELGFSYCHFDCNILQYRTTLRHLSFEYCTGSDYLCNLPVELETLSLTGSLLKSSLIDQLPLKLQSLSLRKMLYIDSGLITALSALTYLHLLDLSGTEWLGTEHIHAILNALPHLRSLFLYDCPQLTTHQLEKLQRPKLQILHNCKLRDDTEDAVREYLISLIL